MTLRAASYSESADDVGKKKAIPDSWRRAKVVLLFKKGDAALPANYRPISLLPVGYKVLASMLHHRLIGGGADARMRDSQYGFRPGRGTADALMLVRRMIDAAHVNNSGGMLLLMLDWAKAFDRVKPDIMCGALHRFGLPVEMVNMVRAIYDSRYFVIHDHTGPSSERRQRAGIAQGCPLSPYLFIAVQSVLLHDVFSRLDLRDEPAFLVTRDVLYADDTLLASQHQENLQHMLNAIVEEGMKYGLELNWDKTVQIQISTGMRIARPDGGPISSVREAVYLGGLITCDGKVASELSRRIGEASGVFNKLRNMWSHACIGLSRKLKSTRRAC